MSEFKYKIKEDAVIASKFSAIENNLLDNKPVHAYENLKALKKYLYQQYGDGKSK